MSGKTIDARQALSRLFIGVFAVWVICILSSAAAGQKTIFIIPERDLPLHPPLPADQIPPGAVRGVWEPLPRSPGWYYLSRPRPKREPTPTRVVVRPESPPSDNPGDDWYPWWEVNRDAFLKRRYPYEPLAASHHDVVLAALLRAAKSTNPQVRAEAALSLGLLGDDRAFDQLKGMIEDADDLVRIRAWAGMGLLDSERAHKFLEVSPTEPFWAIGWTLTVGLLERPTELLWKRLRERLDDDQIPEAQRLAVWALRTHRTDDARPIFLDILKTTRNVFLFREALSGLADMPDPADQPLLEQIISWSDRDQPIAMIGSTANPPAGRNAVGAAGRELQARLGERGGLRGMAAYALSMHKRVDPAVHAALALPFGLPDSRRIEVADLRRRSAGGIIDATQRELAMGRISQLQGLGILRGVLDRGAMRVLYETSETTSERRPAARSFAALGLGLSIGGGADRIAAEMTDKSSSDLLVKRLQIPNETTFVRSACAMAMGLSKNPGFTSTLTETLEELSSDQEPVIGFSVLAMGMLGDDDALEASTMLIGPVAAANIREEELTRHYASNAENLSLRQIVAHRAAVQGLAALGDPRAVAILVGEWGKDDALSLEVARAMAWCRPTAANPGDDGPQNISNAFHDAMLRLSANDQNPRLAAAATATLGVLHERGGAARLAKLIIGTDHATSMQLAKPARKMNLTYEFPTLPHPQQPILALANPFFYHEMLPQR